MKVVWIRIDCYTVNKFQFLHCLLLSCLSLNTMIVNVVCIIGLIVFRYLTTFYFVLFQILNAKGISFCFIYQKKKNVLIVKYICAGRSQQTRDHTCNIGWCSYSHWLCHRTPRRAHKNSKFHVQNLICFFVFPISFIWLKNTTKINSMYNKPFTYLPLRIANSIPFIELSFRLS